MVLPVEAEDPRANIHARCRCHGVMSWTSHRCPIWRLRWIITRGFPHDLPGHCTASILTAIFCMFSCSLIHRFEKLGHQLLLSLVSLHAVLGVFLENISHGNIHQEPTLRCFLQLGDIPQTAPTRLVLWFTPADNDSDSSCHIVHCRAPRSLGYGRDLC